ncbi:MAG TPA: Amuc_1100 family pilus-like protein [Verrucomicrobiae bacterium]|nr:Amuc_1100 family pilus-like protein [Verrucomicrobiae bacterium]
MNTKWLKDNILLLGFLTVFLVIVGGLVWLQQRAAAKVQEMDNSLAEQSAQINHLREMKPPPTPENIKIVKQSRQELEHLYQDLLGVVSQSHVQTQVVTQPGQFLQLMASKFASLRQNLEKYGVKVPEGFAFGFSRYVGTSSAPPAAGLSEQQTTNVLTQLTRQLDAIQKISDLLIQSKPDEITQILRVEVEPGAGSADALDVPGNVPKGLYEMLPFEFHFSGTKDALQAFLNSLSQSQWFFAVRSVEVVGEQPVTGAGLGTEPVPSETAAAPKRTVLKVTTRIDLIEFPQEPAPKPKKT